MIRCQFLSPRVCNTTASVRQLITSVCMKNSGGEAVTTTTTAIHGNHNQFSDSIEHGNDDGNHVHEIGSTPHHDYIDTSKFQRVILSIGSSIAALVNPHRLTSVYFYIYLELIDDVIIE